MKLLSNSLMAAIDYLSQFRTDDNTPIQFRPHGDSVVISVNGKAYAEYVCRVDSPLLERFAMPFRIPGRLVKELPEDVLVEFFVGSHVKMQVGVSNFVSPLCDLLSLPDPPKVIDAVVFCWDADVFVPEIRAASGCTMDPKHNDAKSCVLIEVLPARETIVATNGASMTWYESKANAKNGLRRDDTALATILLNRSVVPLLLATCKSLGEVKLEIGLSHVVVNCGRRKSILPIQEGAYPKWRDVINQVLDRPVAASVVVSRDSLIHAIRSVKPESQQTGSLQMSVTTHELELVAESDSGGLARTVVETDKPATPFGPLKVSASLLLALCNGWPDDVPVWIEHRGEVSPLTFRRPRFRALLMPMLNKENKDANEVSDAGTRRVATRSGGKPARVLGDSPDRRGFSGHSPMRADDDSTGAAEGGVVGETAGAGAGVI